MLICSMVLRCAGTLKPGFESGMVTADLTTTVIHSSKLLIKHTLDLVEVGGEYFVSSINRNIRFGKLYSPLASEMLSR